MLGTQAGRSPTFITNVFRGLFFVKGLPSKTQIRGPPSNGDPLKDKGFLPQAFPALRMALRGLWDWMLDQACMTSANAMTP